MTNGAAKAFVYRKLAQIASELKFDDATLSAAADVHPKTKTTYNKVRNAVVDIAEKLARAATKREKEEAESTDDSASVG